jgi:acyl-CoA thioesterase
MTDGSDLAWLGLERHGDGRWSFELTPPLSRMDGKLYGGTGIAVSVAAMEAETARDAVWVTTQFAGSADIGERIDLHVEPLAVGRRTTQVRITATVGDRIVLATVGATAAHRDSPVEAQMGTMPSVPGPSEAEPWGSRWRPAGADFEMPKLGWLLIAEMKQVEIGDDRFAVWARMLDGRPQTRSTLGFLADMVPSSVARAAGHMGGGTSLDNAMRFGRLVPTEWILLDFDPWFASGGYLHGGARVWSEDGVLLGYANQTATAMVWTGQSPPWADQQQQS